MSMLLDVILPVFLVIGFGALAAARGWISQEAIDGVMRFAQNFALPVLLFKGVAALDLAVDSISRKAQSLNSNIYDGKGETLIVSAAGVITGTSGDASLLGSRADKLPNSLSTDRNLTLGGALDEAELRLQPRAVLLLDDRPAHPSRLHIFAIWSEVLMFKSREFSVFIKQQLVHINIIIILPVP